MDMARKKKRRLKADGATNQWGVNGDVVYAFDFTDDEGTYSCWRIQGALREFVRDIISRESQSVHLDALIARLDERYGLSKGGFSAHYCTQERLGRLLRQMLFTLPSSLGNVELLHAGPVQDEPPAFPGPTLPC